ncbi:hypothetical protein D3C84_898860 [compost metagenome]
MLAGDPVSRGDADAFVQLSCAFASTLLIHALVFTGERQVRRWRARLQLIEVGGAEALGGGAPGDDDLPWLRVAPGRSALRQGEQARDQCGVDGLWKKCAAAAAALQQMLERLHLGRVHEPVSIAPR